VEISDLERMPPYEGSKVPVSNSLKTNPSKVMDEAPFGKYLITGSLSSFF
jgi:hypothetical protein